MFFQFRVQNGKMYSWWYFSQSRPHYFIINWMQNEMKRDTMHSLHVTHKNLLKRFVAGRSILIITIYDFFHCVVLVRVAGLRIRCFFFSDSIDCTSVYSSDLAKMAEIMGDLDMTGLSTAIRRCWSIWFSAISLLARWRLLGKQHVKLISINVIFHETNVIWQETTWCRL